MLFIFLQELILRDQKETFLQTIECRHLVDGVTSCSKPTTGIMMMRLNNTTYNNLTIRKTTFSQTLEIIITHILTSHTKIQINKNLNYAINFSFLQP